VQDLRRALATRAACSGSYGRRVSELRRFSALWHLRSSEAQSRRRFLRQREAALPGA